MILQVVVSLNPCCMCEPSPFPVFSQCYDMKLQSFNTAKMAVSATRQSFNPSELPYSSQAIPKLKLKGEEFAAELLDRRWTLPRPDSKIEQIVLKPRKAILGGESSSHDHFSMSNNKFPCFGPELAIETGQESLSFFIVRDDLLHPLLNGNKSRKLDALLPLLEDQSVTDVVTCGGCQSAHTAAIAVSCAERGIKSHLILRGEQPDILTGYNLVSTMYGNVSYAPRSVYADRKKMLKSHADSVAGDTGAVLWFDDILGESRSRNHLGSIGTEDRSRKVVIVNEGAGDVVALLGVIRLVQYLSEDHLFGKHKRLKVIVDTGTGTTAVGLGLGALCLGLPWDIIAVMLADRVDGYRQHEKRLISDFRQHFGFPSVNGQWSDTGDSIVNWVERRRPRKFGNILEGEIEACQEIARVTGLLVDPVYTLAAWETAASLAENDTNVVMLHTGGTLGMFGLAQRYKSYFSNLKT